MSAIVESLKEERRGYVLRGLGDRVKQVDAEIRRLGGKVETTEAVPDVETADVPSGRRARK